MRPEAATAALPVPVLAYGPLHCLVLPQYDMVINGRCPEALVLADQLYPGVRAFGDTRTLAFVLQGRMYALAGLGRLHEAETTGEDLLRLQRQAGSEVGQAKVSADLAEIRIRLGRVDEGLHGLALATALLERCPPEHHRYVAAMSSVGEAAKAAELYELADQAARICLNSGRLTGTDRVAAALQHAELLLEWGLRLEQIGHDEEARTRLRHSADLIRTVLDGMSDQGSAADAPLARGLYALALAKLGDTERAARIAAELIVPTRVAGQLHEARLAHLAYAVALRDQGDLTAARREALAARELTAPGGRTARLIFDYELARVDAARRPDMAGDVLTILRNFAQQLWRTRLERIWMLRQARARAELEAERARADEAASRDPLTGLGNRRRFEQQMKALARMGRLHRPVSLALVDADAFKRVNDGHSHAIGDAVLKHIAEILRANCRGEDVAVRFGGDEFALFIEADLTVASRIAERIRRAVAQRDWSDVAERLMVTLSIGVAQFMPGMTTRELFDVADRRLYAAKRAGRNRLTAA